MLQIPVIHMEHQLRKTIRVYVINTVINIGSVEFSTSFSVKEAV